MRVAPAQGPVPPMRRAWSVRLAATPVAAEVATEFHAGVGYLIKR